MAEPTRHWLFKSEPSTWPWEKQKAAGPAGQEWDGVRNYQARNFMREMKIGERGFFYHSNEGKAVVGIVEVAALAHPDSTAKDGAWECVDLRAVMDLPRPVTLETIKADEALKDMVLVTNSRLSVQPVGAAEFDHICRLGGLDPKDALA
ncbi:EVE domain-containing protein [Aurantimonas sp. Leaf443]|uniref:EVE domain-containing protein n=1 Tax=Aurantimonas sp. Leaf443 TaxID=1736378 RepID=UPI0006F6858C|nr:EVE domain-containing protein [Aurantimonas sp. Leaf443]KQT85469.1 ubiquinol-cytochrome C reductase [Aurantimonas sp. Leaf443]